MGIFFYLGLFCFSVFFSVNALCVPVISSTSGTVVDGGSVTINGSGFGVNGPNIIVFDDFESGVNGNSINTGASSATVGGWSNVDADVIYSNLTSVSGNLSMRTDMSQTWIVQLGKVLPSPTQYFFASYWLYIPSDANIPGEGTQDDINWKVLWVQGTDTVDDDLMTPVFLPNGGQCCSWNVGGNDANYTGWFSMDFSKGVWKRVWAWVYGGYSSDGQVHFWELDGTGVDQLLNSNDVTILDTGGEFEQFFVNGYGRSTQNSYPTFDDVYFAAGQNARARVEIGNQSTYNSSTKLAISTVDTWSDTQVTFTVRQGQFVDSESAYLYVFDANGVVNSAGYPVTINNGSAQQLSTPQNLHIVFP